MIGAIWSYSDADGMRETRLTEGDAAYLAAKYSASAIYWVAS